MIEAYLVARRSDITVTFFECYVLKVLKFSGQCAEEILPTVSCTLNFIAMRAWTLGATKVLA